MTETPAEAKRRRCREWYVRNKERERERKLAYRNQNIDVFRERSRRYNASNLPRLAVIARNRRARLKKNGGSHSYKDVRAIFVAQRGKCAYCRRRLTGDHHVDHIMPIALGGSNGRENLQITCVACNKSKSAKHPIEYARQLGKLL